MVFNSYIFLIFFPIVVSIYYLLPVKFRPVWLLISSYYFYMSWNARYACLILLSTVITYATGILIGKSRECREGILKKLNPKVFVAGCIIINLGILFVFKYFNFFFQSISRVLSHTGISFSGPKVDLLLPVGISFYTFQALGYCIDVYRGEILPEKNFLKYALFVSFFPQLVAGPIERSGNLLHQLSDPHPLNYTIFREGIFLMLWGYFQKIVIADRIAVYVDAVYGDYESYPGMYLIIASVLFAFQIYCDFGGYTNIAKGAALILGVELMDNFKQPYFSASCSEFWKRWHISLSSWFRDYVYIPLGGNRKGKIRKYINILIVFGLSGLWHGASFTYVMWGTLNGAFQVVGDGLTSLRKKAGSVLHVRPDNMLIRICKIIITFILIDITWVFFRAESIGEACDIIISMVRVINPQILFDGSVFDCGLSFKGFVVLGLSLLILLIVDIINESGKSIRKIVMARNYWLRAFFFAVSVCVILVFGIWGTGYESDAFLYFQF